jgi:hypothetical protein
LKNTTATAESRRSPNIASDVINTYRVWLRYELFRGKLTKQSYEASEANLQKFLEEQNNATSQAVKAIESELILK